MFHLFNKTYIEIDSYIDCNNNRLVISETQGFPMLQMLDAVFAGKNLAYGPNIESLIGSDKQFPTYIDLLKFCFDFNATEDKKVVIYCDRAAYTKIISLWYKTIFLNIDVEHAYLISQGWLAKEILLVHRSNTGPQKVDYTDFLPSFEDFSAVFDNTTIIEDDTLLSSLEYHRSMEFLLASYVYDGSFKDELKSRVLKMLNRFIEEMFKEAWQSIQANILRKQWQDILGTSEYTISNLVDILDDPVLQKLKSTNAWRAGRGIINEARTPLDITSFTDADIELITSQLIKTHTFSIDAHLTHPTTKRKLQYVELVRKTELTDQDLEDILDIELEPTDDQRFWSIKDMETINIYLVDYVLEARKYNRKDTLAPLLLK